MAMFPDSGVPPTDAKNSLPDVNTAGCDELWYSTSRCQPRFDPAAANAMLAEQMNIVMRGGAQYQCLSLNNVETGIRYIIQHGLPLGTTLAGGPFNYTANMDPRMMSYNDYKTILIVPNKTNQGPVNLSIDGLAWTPIQRNDFQPLESGDLREGSPALISYMYGRWTLVGLAGSQVPLIVKGGIDAWIRTDGNDETGDGTANTPDKAFKTIGGCWRVIGSKYAATPLFTINMRLGIFGDYDGAQIGPFGGAVALYGDGSQGHPNRNGYRIKNVTGPGLGPQDHWTGLQINNLGSFNCYGVTFLADRGPPAVACRCVRIIASPTIFVGCQLEVTATNINTNMIEITAGGSFAAWEGELPVIGNGHTVGHLIQCDVNSAFRGAFSQSGAHCNWRISNLNFNGWGVSVMALSVVHWGYSNIIQTNVTGRAHLVRENSILNYFDQPRLGNLPGVVQSGGQVIPPDP